MQEESVSGGEDSGAGLKSGGELKVSSLLEFAQGGAEFTTVQCQLSLRCWWILNAGAQELKTIFLPPSERRKRKRSGPKTVETFLRSVLNSYLSQQLLLKP